MPNICFDGTSLIASAPDSSRIVRGDFFGHRFSCLRTRVTTGGISGLFGHGQARICRRKPQGMRPATPPSATTMLEGSGTAPVYR